jgi:transcriptional regulator with XRE-family HTH domain
MRRTELEMSQTELGQAIGVTFQQVQKYENGSNRISASRLGNIASTLQVPVSFFFEDLSDKREDLNTTSSPDFLELMTTSEGLSLAKLPVAATVPSSVPAGNGPVTPSVPVWALTLIAVGACTTGVRP